MRKKLHNNKWQCKESCVQWPKARGFCNWSSELSSYTFSTSISSFWGEAKSRGDRITEGFCTRKCMVVLTEKKKSGCDEKVTVLPKWLLGEVPLYPSKWITGLLNNY